MLLLAWNVQWNPMPFSSILIVYDGSDEAERTRSGSANVFSSEDEEMSDADDILRGEDEEEEDNEEPAGDQHHLHHRHHSHHHHHQKETVLVRMIDFAHTTFEGFMGDEVLHAGPDRGYLSGLDTMIETIEATLM